MGVIRVPVPEVRRGPGEVPGFRGRSVGNGDAFGASVGVAVENLGATVGKVAGTVDRYLELREEDEIFRRQVEYQNKLSEQKLGKLNPETNEMEGGYANQKNGDFSDEKTPEVIRNVDALDEEVLVGLSRRGARKMRGFVASHSQNFREEYSAFVIGKQEAKKDDDFTIATNRLNSELQGLRAESPEFLEKINSFEGIHGSYLRSQGKSEEYIQSSWQKMKDEQMLAGLQGLPFERRLDFYKNMESLKGEVSEGVMEKLRRIEKEDTDMMRMDENISNMMKEYGSSEKVKEKIREDKSLGEYWQGLYVRRIDYNESKKKNGEEEIAGKMDGAVLGIKEMTVLKKWGEELGRRGGRMR
jgi:hypothetical protein